MQRYDFGPWHPMQPVRLRLATSLSRALGVLDPPTAIVAAPPLATDAELATVHTPAYLGAVQAAARHASSPRRVAAPEFGLGTPDNPVFADMHTAGARAVGGTLLAARAVSDGTVRAAVNLAGGLHHAMPAAASGFCIYNDVAVAIRDLLARGVDRVAYVDTDVHHGDGVQTVFADEPRVLTISLHQDPATLWPGTGHATDTGGPAGRGTAVNIPLPPGTCDAGWRRAFHAVVPPVLTAFAPQVLVTQHGCDTHRADPIGGLRLSVDGQRAIAGDLAELADRLCEGRWVATGGGGYDLIDVVPRSWTHLLAIAAGRPLPVTTPLPGEWIRERDTVGARLGADTGPGALTMGDGVDPGFRPLTENWDGDDPVDRVIAKVRQAAFPAFGLDPHL